MNYIKLFFIFLALWISVSIYWAYYFSNIADLKTEATIPKDEIKKEKQLFEKYRINEEVKIWSWDEKSNKKIEIFKKEIPEFKILRSNFDKNKNLKPGEKIIISFENEINLYSLLWFKKVEDWKFSCNWKILKSEKKAERCDSENKIFITKKWEKDKIFKWVVKKSKIDKKTITLSTNLEELQDYQLKILKWVKWFNSIEWVFPITKQDFIFDFSTTDKDWNIKKEETKTEKTSTWELVNNWTWKTLESKNNNENKTKKEMEEWLKNKEKEVWVQEQNNIWSIIENNTTWSWEKIETWTWKISQTWTWEKIKTWTWETNGAWSNTSDSWTWETEN